MNLSVVIIGKNTELTIGACIESICRFTQKFPSVVLELIYVDSNSADNSIATAIKVLKESSLSWRILLIESKEHSASLGRNIGMENANYNEILFIDSDMVVDVSWLAWAIAQTSYRIICGQRYEVHLDNNVCWLVSKDFYKSFELGKLHRPGGMFLLFNATNTNARFIPFLRSEEEADFIAQDLNLYNNTFRDIQHSFIHLNKKSQSPLNKLLTNLRSIPASSNYICGRIVAINHGYYCRIVRSSYYYEVGAICSFIFYSGLISLTPEFVLFAITLSLLPRSRMTNIYRMFMFPIELIYGIFHHIFKINHYEIKFKVLYASNDKRSL